MKLTTKIVYQHLIPAILGVVIVLGVTLGVMSQQITSWIDSVQTNMITIQHDANSLRSQYFAKHIDASYSSITNSVLILRNGLKWLIEDADRAYDFTSFSGISSILTEQLEHFDSHNLTYSDYTKNSSVVFSPYIQTFNELQTPTIHNKYLNETSHLDLWFDSIRTNPFVQKAYVGFSNGLFRRYPYTTVDSYTNMNYVCEKTQQYISYYLPECRSWYQLALNSDSEVSFTSPYVDVSTQTYLTTASAVYRNGLDVGVVGIDMIMSNIDDMIVNIQVMKTGYAFLINESGQVVSHKDLDRTRKPPDITEIENLNLTNSHLIDKLNTESVIELVKTDGSTWFMYPHRLENNYVIVLSLPKSDIDNMLIDIRENSIKQFRRDIGIMIGVSFILIVLLIVLNRRISLVIVKPFNEMIRVFDSINNNSDPETDAVINIDIAPDINETISVVRELPAVIRTAYDLYVSGDPQKSIIQYVSALSFFEKIGNKAGIGICCNNIGSCYKKLNDVSGVVYLKKSILICEELIEEAKNSSNTDNIIKLTSILANRVMNLGTFYSACMSNDSKFVNGTCFNNGTNLVVNLTSNEPTETIIDKVPLDLFDKAIQLFESVEDILGYAKASSNKGEYFINVENKFDDAKNCLMTAYNLASRKTDLVSLQYIDYCLALVEKKRNNFRIALAHAVRSINYEKRDYDVEQLTLIILAELLEHYDLEQSNRVRNLISDSHLSKLKDITFIIDCSDSMNLPVNAISNNSTSRIDICKIKMKDIIDNELSFNDLLSLTTFNTRVHHIFSKYTKSHNYQEILQTLNTIVAKSGTAFYDAVYDVVSESYESLRHEIMIVALTDGDDNHSKKSYNELIQLLKDKQTVGIKLMIISIGTNKNAPVMRLICNSVPNNGGYFVEIAKADTEGFNFAFLSAQKFISGGMMNMEMIN